MKVLLVGPKWIGGWLEGVERGIQMLGHEVKTFAYSRPNAPSAAQNKLFIGSYAPAFLQSILQPVAKNIGSQWENRMNHALMEAGAKYRADLVLLLKGELLQAETIDSLKLSGKLVVSWWVDDPVLYFQNYGYPQVADQLRLVDAFFIYDYGGFDELRKHGVSNPFYLPCACDPDIYHPKVVGPLEQELYKCDIGFVANYYPERGKLMEHSLELNVAVWGSGWKKFSQLSSFPPGTLRAKRLMPPDVATVYNVAAICPNAHHSQSRAGGLNMRTYEIPAAGGFEITDYIPGMEEQFEIGSELIVYRSPEHFRELAEHYLNHPEERKAIAERGRKRVLKDHTYQQRMKSMFEVLK